MNDVEKKTPQNTGGLAGVVAGTTAVCAIGQEGMGLAYRGYAIEDLAAHSTFEEVAHLLLYGSLPSQTPLAIYRRKLTESRALPSPLLSVLEQIPAETHPMDVMRTGCSFLGNLEPEDWDRDRLAVTNRLLAAFPAILVYWHHYHTSGKRIETSTEESSIAGHFLRLLHGTTPDDTMRRVVDVSLILYAEHGFNASTFTARTVTSTQSDTYSAITAPIGALKGVLHGGANEAAMELIEQFHTPGDAEAGLMEKLSYKQRIMGFGHRVYRNSDPRSNIIKSWAETLCRRMDAMSLFAVAERIEQVMRREKNLFPNVDFYSAITYRLCGIPTAMFTPLFVMARTAGWSAHISEQRSENKLIHPEADYNGPTLQRYVALNERDDSPPDGR